MTKSKGVVWAAWAAMVLIEGRSLEAETDWQLGAKGRTQAVLEVRHCAPAGYDWPTFTHSASITELRDGRMGAVWYAGSAEGKPDCKCWFSRYTEGKGWETSRAISGDDTTVDNTILFQPKKKGAPLLAYYKLKPTGRYRIVTSTNDGNTWSAPRSPAKNDKLPTGEFVGCDANQPLELPDGSLLMPSGTSGGGRNPSWWVERSTNGIDMELWSDVMPGAHQPAFLVLSPDFKRLQMIARGGHSYLSEDMGKTWAPLPPGTAPKSNARGDAKTLDNGWHVNVATNPGRQQVNVSVSRDGRTWEDVLSGPAGGRGYPTITQSSDRKLHLLYSDKPIRHVVLDADILCGIKKK